jgi:hypothetical protein
MKGASYHAHVMSVFEPCGEVVEPRVVSVVEPCPTSSAEALAKEDAHAQIFVLNI